MSILFGINAFEKLGSKGVYVKKICFIVYLNIVVFYVLVEF